MKEDDEKDEYKIFLHIGIQRTGTTFLQQEVFPFIREINLVKLGFRELNGILKNMEKYGYDVICKKIYSRFKISKINLISNENIWWHPQTEGNNKRFNKIEKIKQLFPNAKIIFGIRDKTDLILSLYNQYVVDGCPFSFQEFQENVANINDFDYEQYVGYLFELFGNKNLYIYRFEDMKEDIYSHVKGICNFFEVDVPEFKNKLVNVSYSHWQLRLSLLLNRFFKTPLNPNGIIHLPFSWPIHKHIFQSPYFPKKLRGRKVTLEDLKI